MIFISISLYENLRNLKYNYNEIKFVENKILDEKKNLQNMENSNTDISNTDWINYSLWIKECAGFSNMFIYNHTNNLEILSLTPQRELDIISRNFTIAQNNKNYDKFVKFIIINKSEGTFLTNDIQNIDLIKKNIKIFSKENGELYNYVSNRGKWFNITYNSESAPAYKYYNERKLKNPSNFVEAYWFPKNYSYSKEDEVLLKDILQSNKKNIKDEINYNNNYISDIKNYMYMNKIYILIHFSLLIIILLILYYLGKGRILRSLKNAFIIKLIKFINNWFDNKSTFFKIIIFVLSSSLILVLIYMMLLKRSFGILYTSTILLYLIFIFPKIIKFSLYIDEIIKGIDKITNGDLEHVIEEKGDKSLCSLAQNINKLNKGFKVSIEDQIKNEKLKSELVANVSHDLKTPLTSIINYTDILLRENISEEEKEDFLKILNKKSLKLKKLIEDLFEISKINSGKIQLNKEEVDVIELVNQSIAEYSDTEIYTDKNLKFVVKTFKDKLPMILDGNRMSRVFENLINNALKYSLNDTRVFVEIEEINRGIKLSFKNTSSAPLDFDKEEIFERFTRGDSSRNSNISGNGLGLAIAKSIVELHGGIMYVNFDGDLFKCIIELYH
ncbi:HAMP domain-containing histidine kinase [Clostridium tetanomorphum]|uniref:histidine kinase n=2 Tax=Clostridium tetanomorphum TaxID=1553 RepID=A0A923ECC6_CLOTT|nr:HAMP domain-containing histidine kinase [Clostridium tetanomorphum]